MKIPAIFKLLLPLLIGVIVHFYSSFSVPLGWIIALIILLFGLSTPFFSKLKFSTVLFEILLFVVFFFLGGFVADIHNSSSNQNYFAKVEGYQNEYCAKILEVPEEKEKSVKAVVEIMLVNDIQTCGKALVYFEKDSSALNLKYGDLLIFQGNFSDIKSNGNPKEFDYQRYLRIHNIQNQAYLRSSSWVTVGNDAHTWLTAVYDLRQYFADLLQNSNMKPKNSMVASALLLGQKEYLDKDVLRSYSSAGAMHVLAVSGLHVGIIMLILQFIISPIKRVKHGKKIFVLMVLFGIWFYALITGLSPSVLRAAVMFTFIVVGQELERETNIYQSILVSAFILILIEPYIIFQVGFQLSYLAVLGIVFLQPKIVNLIFVKNKLLHKAWQISAVSIAAQIATFPLGLYYFHQFPNFFLLSNLLVIPLAFFILILGIAFFVFHLVPFLSDLLLFLFDSLLSILNWGVMWVEELPYSIMWGISITWYEVFILYLTIFFAAIAFIKRKTNFLIYSLVGMIVFISFSVYEKWELDSENVMYVYNINDEVAIDVFYGRNNQFYSSQDLIENEEKLLFHVKHNWFYRTGQEDPTEWINLNESEVIQFGNNQLFMMDDTFLENESLEIPKTNFVLLHHLTFIPEEILRHFISEQTQVILGPKIKYKVKKFITLILPLEQIHDLSETGAFEFYFD